MTGHPPASSCRPTSETPTSSSTACSRASQQPFTIRLVKGAYWEHETVEAQQHGWSSPVFGAKVESDRSFERLTKRLLTSART